MSEICFDNSDFNFYLVVLVCMVVFFIYIIYSGKETISNVQLYSDLTKAELLKKNKKLHNNLYSCKKDLQTCETNLYDAQSRQQTTQEVLLNRIYNPLTGPVRTYAGGRLNAEGYTEYQQIGMLYKDNERYPLYSRPKYPGRTTKYEYYIIDETRNRLKIPFKSRNDDELYDGEEIFIDVLDDTFKIKIYEYDNMRYIA